MSVLTLIMKDKNINNDISFDLRPTIIGSYNKDKILEGINISRAMTKDNDDSLKSIYEYILKYEDNIERFELHIGDHKEEIIRDESLNVVYRVRENSPNSKIVQEEAVNISRLMR